MDPRILIVDDTPRQLDFLMRTASGTLRGNWQVVPITSYEEACLLVETEGESFSIAVLDVYLTHPEQHQSPEGLRLAAMLKRVNHACQIILVSSYIEHRSKLDPDSPIDDFVSLALTNLSNPKIELEKALRRAGDRSPRRAGGRSLQPA